MTSTTNTISLVERKTYNVEEPHSVGDGVWWVGYFDNEEKRAYNSFLLVDAQEAILINPGSRSNKVHKAIRQKVNNKVNLKQIHHIVVCHGDPDIGAATPLFEKKADSRVQVYAPRGIAETIHHYGSRNPVISLTDGDSIIMKTGRVIDYIETPGMGQVGSGFFYDKFSGTIFTGNIFGCFPGEWNLFAPAKAYENLIPCPGDSAISRKDLIRTINKIERLSPQRICLQNGPIIEDNIDQYYNAARQLGQ